MALDSAAAFSERVQELLLDGHKEKFTQAGWSTMAHLAFACPQNADDATFVKKVVIPGLGVADHTDEAILRRFYYECFMAASADLRRRNDPDAEDAPRKMPAAERRERFMRVEKRLSPGVKMVGELEVSHRLIERCVTLVDANSIKYVPLECCTKRDSEVQGIEKEPTWEQYPDPILGTMRLKMSRDELRSPIDCQFAFEYALKRRGIAMEMADMLSYENHELLRELFVEAIMEEPYAGFQRFSLDQIIEADRHFWKLMARATRDGIRRSGCRDRPCDLVMEKVLASRAFTVAMTPRQLTRGAAPAEQQPALSNTSAAASSIVQGVTRSQLKKQKQQAKTGRALPAPPPQLALKNGSAKGGAGKARTGTVRLPPGLHGMCARSSKATNSKRLCFSYNLGNCQAASPGNECAKGAHLCMKPSANGEACSKSHSQKNCTS